MSRVVVIGAGVIGTACAHYLSSAGCRVTLLDRGKVGGGCSHGNCGFVCPSHVLPLAGPGMIGRTLRTLLERESPLKIRPRLDPALWSWLVHFARRCNHADMLESGRAIQALLNSGRALYGELFRSGVLEAEWQELGLLFVFLTHAAMEHYSETDRLLREEFGVGARRHDSAALAALEPALKPGLAGAWHYECDAHLRPDLLVDAWRKRVETQGVEVREGCEFVAFEHDRRTVRGVRTTTGVVQAESVVVATGAWTPLLTRHLGCEVPIQPGKGYSITMPRPARCPRIPIMFEEHRVAITPMRETYRIGSTMEFAGYDTTLNRARLDYLVRGASHYLPEAEGPRLEEWWGWRPMVYDGKPIIDRSPAWENVWIAAGHGMLGVSMAPATGKLIAEMVSGTTPHVDPVPYAAGRFVDT